MALNMSSLVGSLCLAGKSGMDKDVCLGSGKPGALVNWPPSRLAGRDSQA